MGIYIFHREVGFYPIFLKDDKEARKNAEINPGTKMVTTPENTLIWPEHVNLCDTCTASFSTCPATVENTQTLREIYPEFRGTDKEYFVISCPLYKFDVPVIE